MPQPVTFHSKFFPKLDLDDPPISIQESAEQKLLLVLNDIPNPCTRDAIHQEHLCLLNDSPGFAAFFLTYLDRYERLLEAKPVLIQGTFLP
jgi:hypothetical protein